MTSASLRDIGRAEVRAEHLAERVLCGAAVSRVRMTGLLATSVRRAPAHSMSARADSRRCPGSPGRIDAAARGDDAVAGGRDDVGEERLLARVVAVERRLGHAEPRARSRASCRPRSPSRRRRRARRRGSRLGGPRRSRRSTARASGASVRVAQRIMPGLPAAPTRCTKASSSVGSTRSTCATSKPAVAEEARQVGLCGRVRRRG